MESLSISDRSIYEPLPHEKCTRILRVLKSSPTQHEKLTIQISILDMNTVVRLDDDAPNRSLTDEEGYDALSYTWGPPLYGAECEREYSSAHDVSVILKNDTLSCSMAIGKNLYEALLHIWESGRRRALWVDALCINQQDLAEKSKRILLMDSVYSKADQVLVWLGHDDPDSPTFDDLSWLHTTVLDQIQKFYSEIRPHTREDIIRAKVEDGEVGGIRINWLPNASVEIPAKALRTLYRFYARRRYLSRAWVVQEIALSRKALALIGKTGLRFDRLGMLVRALGTSDLGGMASGFIESIPGGNSGTGQELSVILTAADRAKIPGSYAPNGSMRTRVLRAYGAYNDLAAFFAALEIT